MNSAPDPPSSLERAAADTLVSIVGLSYRLLAWLSVDQAKLVSCPRPEVRDD
jgi:hypothetical protein